MYKAKYPVWSINQIVLDSLLLNDSNWGRHAPRQPQRFLVSSIECHSLWGLVNIWKEYANIFKGEEAIKW